MNPIEVIYDGYIEDNKTIDTEETTKASDSLLEMMESLLPNNEKIQNVLFAECLNLAMLMLSQKQGFKFSLEVMLVGKADK